MSKETLLILAEDEDYYLVRLAGRDPKVVVEVAAAKHFKDDMYVVGNLGGSVSGEIEVNSHDPMKSMHAYVVHAGWPEAPGLAAPIAGAIIVYDKSTRVWEIKDWLFGKAEQRGAGKLYQQLRQEPFTAIEVAYLIETP
jgi:hypothetical protein